MIDAMELGNSAIQGLILGVVAAIAFKFASKAIKFLLVIQFVILKWLESRHIIIVDWHRITLGLAAEKDLLQQADTIVYSLIDMGSFGIAAIIGFTSVRRVFK
mgnify:CR=1 FL=1|jgi:uncharacterized membrane protein (Fun14 family)|tara:strand:- start:122 stop:430 length:309 start_codon:yes stop_codon:yes gene_type:complete